MFEEARGQGGGLDALVALGRNSNPNDGQGSGHAEQRSTVPEQQLNFEVRVPKTEPGLHDAVCLTHKPREQPQRAPQMCYELPATCFDAADNEMLSDVSSAITFESGPISADLARRATRSSGGTATNRLLPVPIAATRPSVGLPMPLLLGLLGALLLLLLLGLWLLA